MLQLSTINLHKESRSRKGKNLHCLGEVWRKFHREFSPQTGYVQTDDTDYEIYYEKGEKGLFCELWIPVKKSFS
ncbi:MAG: GyrI-like domain-containing protein [Lachnospiraceae bacterium]|nr:GyrI-like domain-containing protein [Lachnospiraceae bacterium]